MERSQSLQQTGKQHDAELRGLLALVSGQQIDILQNVLMVAAV